NKQDYFNTMFYRTYLGVPLQYLQQDQQGNYQAPEYSMPCWGLKHFALEYISPYLYTQGRHAVIIAKYYEGAYLNGSVKCNNTTMFAQIGIYDKYGMLHDNTFTDEKGNFSLISPAGNITLQLSVGDVLLKSIRFNQTNNTLYSPVTDAEAMRLNGSRYSRNFNISVNLSTLEGFVYRDNNNNGSYEPANDTPLPGITIELNDYYFGRPVQPTTTNADGHYIFKDIYPSKYNISAVNESGYTLLNMKGINVEPDNNTYNISQPKPSAINGVVYFDTNKDSKYTTGEEISDVNVRLTYTKLDGSKMPVTIATTGAVGSYAFPSLMPGEYTVNATKLNIITGHLDYLTTQTITLTANKTSWVNISLTYAPILVSGYTTHDTIKIANNITVTFAPDKSVKNNTATKQISVTSNTQGLYAAKLAPGTYNVTAKKTEGTTTVYNFTGGKLIVFIGEGTASYNIPVTKESVTVRGSITYNGVGKTNLPLLFSKDSRIANNTAVQKGAITDINGNYTTELTPGSYNASVEQRVNESGKNITYTGTGQITLNIGDKPKTLNILLARKQSP
ncbi:MAG: hypothetical protein NTX92_08785, partial [Euryarchaeota archaeon]|nr:hypothetical protein [Euryarchaeota archaeon]